MNNDKTIENLKQYSVKCRIINGIETYIIPPEHYDKISKLLGKAEYLINRYINSADADNGIHMGIVRINSFWEPVNILDYNNELYHVHVSDQWVCSSCGYVHKGRFALPMTECEMHWYNSAECKEPNSVFSEIICNQCGSRLAAYIIRI